MIGSLLYIWHKQIRVVTVVCCSFFFEELKLRFELLYNIILYNCGFNKLLSKFIVVNLLAMQSIHFLCNKKIFVWNQIWYGFNEYSCQLSTLSGRWEQIIALLTTCVQNGKCGAYAVGGWYVRWCVIHQNPGLVCKNIESSLALLLLNTQRIRNTILLWRRLLRKLSAFFLLGRSKTSQNVPLTLWGVCEVNIFIKCLQQQHNSRKSFVWFMEVFHDLIINQPP